MIIDRLLAARCDLLHENLYTCERVGASGTKKMLISRSRYDPPQPLKRGKRSGERNRKTDELVTRTNYY